eukprot:scaffold5096_cov116-Isochrysis_galbana.AAC.1
MTAPIGRDSLGMWEGSCLRGRNMLFGPDEYAGVGSPQAQTGRNQPAVSLPRRVKQPRPQAGRGQQWHAAVITDTRHALAQLCSSVWVGVVVAGAPGAQPTTWNHAISAKRSADRAWVWFRWNTPDGKPVRLEPVAHQAPHVTHSTRGSKSLPKDNSSYRKLLANALPVEPQSRPVDQIALGVAATQVDQLGKSAQLPGRAAPRGGVHVARTEARAQQHLDVTNADLPRLSHRQAQPGAALLGRGVDNDPVQQRLQPARVEGAGSGRALALRRSGRGVAERTKHPAQRRLAGHGEAEGAGGSSGILGGVGGREALLQLGRQQGDADELLNHHPACGGHAVQVPQVFLDRAAGAVATAERGPQRIERFVAAAPVGGVLRGKALPEVGLIEQLGARGGFRLPARLPLPHHLVLQHSTSSGASGGVHPQRLRRYGKVERVQQQLAVVQTGLDVAVAAGAASGREGRSRRRRRRAADEREDVGRQAAHHAARDPYAGLVDGSASGAPK